MNTEDQLDNNTLKAINSSINNEDEDVHRDIRYVQFVSFLLENIECGIKILSIHEILQVPDITRLPNTPSFIKGVINLRGNVIPVVDVRDRFDLSAVTYTESTRIIVVETRGKLIGLLVDIVNQVLRIPEGDIEPPSDLIKGISEEFIMGIGRLSDRLIVILNHDNILTEEDENQDLTVN